MQAWVEEHPTTARALVAAILEACQFCEQAQNRREVAQILAQSRYLDTAQEFIEPALLGNYSYGGFDNQERLEKIPDFYRFYGQNSDDPEKPNPVNYPWRSHGMWLLTQMIRWGQIEQQDYPKDADEILEEIYPLDVYTEVAEALKIELPSAPMKVEPATVFIDQRQFDPSDPIAYLNNFEIQA
jgi:nitrate/nitrite transport system substrate-binding protein